MKRAVILVLAFLVLLSSITLAIQSASISILKDEIFANETAVYKLAVYNPSSTISQYMIYSPDVEWSISTDPSKDYILKVYPNSETETLVKVSPYIYTKPGLYGININVKNLETDDLVTKKVVLEIKSSGGIGQYVPSLHLNVFVPEQLDPRKPFKARVEVINQNTLNLTEVEIHVQSKTVSIDNVTNLGSLESKIIDFFIQLRPDQQPVQDSIKVTGSVKLKGRLYQFESFPATFDILEYGKIVQTDSSQHRFLVDKYVISLSNNGNAVKQYSVQRPYSLLKSLFTSSNPRASVQVIDSQKYYVWPVVLGAGESMSITQIVNYWPLLIIIIVIIIGTLLYYLLRSPVVMLKSSQVLSIRHGGISELKIQIDIKNRSSRSLKNVHILDKLPNLLDYQKEVKPGIVEPDRILHSDKKGTILKWTVGTLEPMEERVLTYRAVSRLSILGGLSLPAVFISFDREGVEGSSTSNVLFLKM